MEHTDAKKFSMGRKATAWIAIVIVLIALACGFALWKFQTPEASTIPTAAPYGYVVRDGKVYWQEHIQTYTGTSTPPAQRHNEFEVADAEAATFQTAPLQRGDNLEADADPTTFAGITNAFGKDATHIFYQGLELLVASGTPAIDTASFEPLGTFVKDKRGVYEIGIVRNNEQGYWLIPGLDPKTFVVVNREYAKDKNAVYYIRNNGTGYDVLPIAGLDPATFRVIGVCASAEGYASYAVADAHTVLAVETPIPGADPATFHIVGLVDENPGGFPITGSYAIDKNHVYKDCSEIVPGVDPVQCTADNLKGCE